MANYRSTIHCTSSVSPASFMFGREMVKSFVVLSPNFSYSNVIVDEEEIAHKMKTKSEYRKSYYDKSNHVKVPIINCGDYVRIRDNELGSSDVKTSFQMCFELGYLKWINSLVKMLLN